ncbi:putative THO complex subunit 1 [Apostichopus japonicus]|uniref:Putative THO complex subunit 1 n=1 Tax=Stichopus japonicus TaxID=307972 RepID=A0A2G8JFE2_STIJA|nr:putative THO complex subunit 1 [Apostichopus japonicus]
MCDEQALAEPVTEDELQVIAPKIANDRKTVARNLGLADNEIAIIEADSDKAGQGGIREKAFQMLLKWKRSNGEHATKRILRDALRVSGFQDVAEELERNIR